MPVIKKTLELELPSELKRLSCLSVLSDKFLISFLRGCEAGEKNIKHIIDLAHWMTRRSKVHPHYFDTNTLYANAEYLVLHAFELDYDVEDRAVYHNRSIDLDDVLTVFALLEKRVTHRIPMEYITKEARYLGRRFIVNEHTLIPRSIMSSRFSDFLADVQWSHYRVLDLCTGSGCIGITLESVCA